VSASAEGDRSTRTNGRRKDNSMLLHMRHVSRYRAKSKRSAELVGGLYKAERAVTEVHGLAASVLQPTGWRVIWSESLSDEAI